MYATEGGHTETLALLLSLKADVHTPSKVIIAIVSFEYSVLYFDYSLVWVFLNSLEIKEISIPWSCYSAQKYCSYDSVVTFPLSSFL